MYQQLKITTKSFTSFADIVNNTFIDSDVSYDVLGLPIIKSRRIKGLLKESAIEILELISDTKKEEIINKLFGKKGNTNAAISFGNFYLENYTEICNEINEFNNTKENKTIYPNFCKEQFTSLIASTAIDHKNKSAVEKSLRTIRALNPGLSFNADIFLANLTGDEKNIFDLAIKNLQEGGLSRNRGLGNIELKLVNSEIANTHLVKGKEVLEIPNISSVQLIYELVEPTLIPKAGSEPNTIETASIFPGNTLRGVYAKHKDKSPNFKSIIDGEKINFGFGFPVDKDNSDEEKTIINYPMPLFLHQEKDLKGDLNIFKTEELINSDGSARITKPIAGIGNVYTSGSKYEYSTLGLKKEVGFHGSRDNNTERLKGMSEDGEIFYYEALSAGQLFAFNISGESTYITEIVNILMENPMVNFGKSKNVQYGKAKLLDIKENKPNIKIEENKTYILALQSPAILLNQFGESMPSSSILEEYLKDFDITIDKTKIASNITEVEIANALWKTAPLRYRAYTAGSSFLINSFTIDKLEELLQIGIGEFTDMGFGKLAIYENQKYEKEDVITKYKLKKIDFSKNKIVEEFKKQIKIDKAYAEGFEQGKKAYKEHKDKFSTTMISALYAEVKKSKQEDFPRIISKDKLSPKVHKELEDSGLLKTFEAKANNWELYTQPYLLGFFKAMRIQSKK